MIYALTFIVCGAILWFGWRADRAEMRHQEREVEELVEHERRRLRGGH